MKKHIITPCFIAIILVATNCQDATIDETATNVTFLIDVTDKPIYEAIESDFNQNLNTFFTNTGVGNIDFGQRLTIRMGAIDESDQLTLQSKSIALLNKNISRKEAQRQRDPRPCLQMISAELARYKQLSEKQMSSPIIDVILKAFREMSPESREILVICTDGIEYNPRYANFYKSIPTSEQSIENLISKIDPILLSEAEEQIALADPEVIIVLKPNDKVIKTAELKQAYNELMRQIGVNTVRFIDNLSNNPNL